MFKNLIQDIEIQAKNKKPIGKSNIEFKSSSDITISLCCVDTLQDHELYNIISKSYKSILRDIYKKDQLSYIDLFTRPRFITMLSKVLSITAIDREEQTHCNKLIYDFLTIKDDVKNISENEYKQLKDLMLNLAKVVNVTVTAGLKAIGLTDYLSTYIALTRYSSFDEKLNVTRLNLLILTQSPELMTEQTIINIYQTLFDGVSDLFKSTMFDVYDENEEWIRDNPDIIEVYSNISNAVLLILESLPSAMIRQILISYHGDLTMWKVGKLTRFKLSAISSGDFPKTSNVIEILKDEGIYIY